MMTLRNIMIVLLTLSVCHGSYARIGWTRKQMDEKFKMTEELTEGSMVNVCYIKKGFLIYAIFIDGIVEGISYSTRLPSGGFGKDLTETQIQAFLKLNSRGKRWSERDASKTFGLGRLWKMPGCEAYISRRMQSLIFISTSKYDKVQKKDAKAEQKAEKADIEKAF